MDKDSRAVHGVDDSRINIDEDYDLRAWSDRFGVDKQRVEDAVKTVGDHAAAVERYLNRKLC